MRYTVAVATPPLTAISAPSAPPATGPDGASPLARVRHYPADLLAIAYIGAIGLIAATTGAFYVLFPELGALSWEVMRRPRGRWSSAPLMLAMSPALTGVIGTLATRHLPYGLSSVTLTVCGSIAIIRLIGSPIAPAISAGLLPLVLGVTSWWYPPGILLGSLLLTTILLGWRDYVPMPGAPAPHLRSGAAETPHDASGDFDWFAPLMIFVVAAAGMVKLTGLRFILFPPLVVILYEMFHAPRQCPWIPHLGRLPIVCFLAALGGLMMHQQVHLVPVAAMLSMAWGVAILRLFRTHVPPALAVALLPMVMARPTLLYPISVGIGIGAGTLWFLLVQGLRPARTDGPL